MEPSAAADRTARRAILAVAYALAAIPVLLLLTQPEARPAGMEHMECESNFGILPAARNRLLLAPYLFAWQVVATGFLLAFGLLFVRGQRMTAWIVAVCVTGWLVGYPVVQVFLRGCPEL